jgi:FolB domain-containing protein
VDYIHIKDITVSGKHGVSEEERAEAQEFIVSIRIGCDTHRAGMSDDLTETIDYGDLRRIVVDCVSGESCKLIERLAENIAQKILENTRTLSAEVRINKPIWKNGSPGVTIFRQRE